MIHSARMRVGIDATVVAQPQIVGIGRFIQSLASAFAATDADHEFLLFYRLRAFKRPRYLWRPEDPRFKIRVLADTLDRFTLPKLDLFHATSQRLPKFAGATPYLATVHDVFYASRPEMTNPDACRLWVGRYRDIAARSRLIMTVSDYSKREIVEHLGVEEDRVRVVLEAAAPSFTPRPAMEIAAARARHGLAQPYVLFAGGFDARKNLPRAIAAFSAAAADLPPDVVLAVGGGGGPLEDESRRAAAASPVAKRIRFLGFIPDADFPALMSGCETFFFPSLFEGFGLPALEAMACGAAVVTASTTSLPQICGDAALLADPEDVDALAAALREAVGNGARRDELRARGAARARQFTWSRTAAETLELYRETLRSDHVARRGSTTEPALASSSR